jgi:hypothetical protein
MQGNWTKLYVAARRAQTMYNQYVQYSLGYILRPGKSYQNFEISERISTMQCNTLLLERSATMYICHLVH